MTIANPNGSNNQGDEDTHFGYLNNGVYHNYITGERNIFRASQYHQFGGGRVYMKPYVYARQGSVESNQCVSCEAGDTVLSCTPHTNPGGADHDIRYNPVNNPSQCCLSSNGEPTILVITCFKASP